MTSGRFTGLAVLLLTLLGFFVFPGHTILQSDTQIYIPILEHIADPGLLTNDIMAVRPHVSFTLYDEAALLLHRITGLPFEHVLIGQQLVCRALAVLGFYWFAAAAGLAPPLAWPPHAWMVTALASLGAAVMGPAVLLVEYEPVPRGFALPLVVLSLAQVARRHWIWAAACATAGFAFHPPTALAYCGFLAGVLLWRRNVRALAVLAIGPALLLLTLLAQPPLPESPLFGRIDPALEALQRSRAAYNWVDMWAPRWMPVYVALWAIGATAWWRLRRDFSSEVSLFVLGLPAIGMLSVPVSYALLERMKWVIIPQFQPGRYLLFVTLFAILLSAMAAVRAGERRAYGEAFLFFLFPIAAAATEWDTAKLAGGMLALVFVIALTLAGSMVWRRKAWAIGLAAILPFFALPYVGGVRNYAPLHTPHLDGLAAWAREHTPKDALFQFADVGRGLQPGVFRARAKRAIYCDWKSGGQVNFLKSFSVLWAERWQTARVPQPVNTYRGLGIDFVVFSASNPQTPLASVPSRDRQGVVRNVFENPDWIVYDLR